MSYLTIADWKAGVDRTRPIHSLPSGTLWQATNCHISPGGDIEMRKAFVAKHSLPVNTYGLAADAEGLVTFGSDASPSVPSAIAYQRLDHPSGAAMDGLLSWDLFDGEIYAIASYVDGSVHHFLDATRVSDWDTSLTPFPLGKGTIAKTHNRKLHSPYGVSPAIGGSILGFSEVDVATGWEFGVDDGAGFINMSTHSSGSALVTALGAYQEKLAIFSRRVIQIWTMQTDEDLNAPFQIVEEAGTTSPRSVKNFGSLDLFYCDASGIHSLRARDNTNSAGVQDVGTPIDKVFREYIKTLTVEQLENAIAAVEPEEERFWLWVGMRVFVFSYFPSKKVSAWTWYEPGFSADDIVQFEDQLWVRAGTQVYLYGGDDGDDYDDPVVTVQLPFNTIRGKDGTFKQFEGMDIAAEGEWTCSWLVDPNNLDRKVHIGDLDDVTYSVDERNQGDGHYTHVAPLLVHQGAGVAASLSTITLYHEQADNKD